MTAELLAPAEPAVPSGQPVRQAEPPVPPASELGPAIAESAEYYLTHTPKGFRDDCSGFVCASVTRAGLPLQGGSMNLWDLADAQGLTHKRKIPRVGDIAFFDNTYDRDRNGRNDDPLSHVAVVLSVAEDGTIHLAHGGTSKGRTDFYMNLREPDVYRDEEGRVLNSYLRRVRDTDPKKTKHLAGELWHGFATLRETEGLADDG